MHSGLPILAAMGYGIPTPTNKFTVLRELAYTRWMLRGNRIEALTERANMTDTRALIAMRLLLNVTFPAYLSDNAVFALCVLKGVQLSVRAGNVPSASHYLYAFCGVIIGTILEDYDRLYRLGQLAYQLAQRPGAVGRRADTLNVVYFFTTIFHCHWHDNVPLLRANYHTAMEDGAVNGGIISLMLSNVLAFLSGWSLNELAPTITADRQLAMRIGEHISEITMHQLHQTIINLREPMHMPTRLRGASYDETIMFPQHRSAGDDSCLLIAYVLKLLLCVVFHEIDEGLSYLSALRRYQKAGAGTPYIPVYHWYAALTCLAAVPDARPAQRRRLLRRVAASQQKLKQWAHYGPMNYLHKWHLVEAERCRVTGQHAAAREHYDQAMSGAREHGYLHEAALACELAGRFYQAQDNPRLAQLYLQDAYAAYDQWGATAKVQQLENQHADLLHDSACAVVPLAASTTDSTRHATTSGTTHTSALDVASLLKATSAISPEIALEKLLARLLQVLLENAGAERGALLLRRNEQWLVEAAGQVGAEITVLQAIPLAQAEFPQSIVSYVLRTSESVVLHDAPADDQYAQDRYIQQQQPLSVLCMPLLHHGELMGLLYLENRRPAIRSSQSDRRC